MYRFLIYPPGWSDLDRQNQDFARMPSHVYWDITQSHCAIGTGWTSCDNSSSPNQGRTSPNPHTIVPLEQGGQWDDVDKENWSYLGETS